MTQNARSRTVSDRPRRRIVVAGLTMGLAWLAAAGATQAQAPVARPASPPAPVATPSASPAQGSDRQPDQDYVIGPTDVLSIVIHDEREVVHEVTVRPDGKVTLPLINDVVAAGLTPSQLRVRIIELEKRFIKVPVVTVIVRQVNNNRAFITGQVRTPGSYVLPGPTTVLQLLAMAGGFAEFADREHILITRVEQGVQKSFTFNYDRALKKQDLSQNILLKPGDTVVVP